MDAWADVHVVGSRHVAQPVLGRRAFPARALHVAQGERTHGLVRDMGHGAAPPGVHDREPPRRGHGHHRHAVGEAKERGHVGHAHKQAVGAFGRSRASVFDVGRVVDGDDPRAVHLVRHHERHAFRAEGGKKAAAVLLHGVHGVLHVSAQVERRIRPRARAAEASRERHADAGGALEPTVGEQEQAALVPWAPGSAAARRLPTLSRRRDLRAGAGRFRKSGMSSFTVGEAGQLLVVVENETGCSTAPGRWPRWRRTGPCARSPWRTAAPRSS